MKKIIFLVLCVFLTATACQYSGFKIREYKKGSSNIPGTRVSYTVTKVVDGDTIGVQVADKKQKVRIIGINTPETVDPRKPVECFGLQASEKAKALLSGKTVILQSDPSQTDRDKYGRLLRYVFLEDGTDYGKTMIENGFAYEYTYDVPYQFQKEYKAAQVSAQKNEVGLWSTSSGCSKK